MNITSNHHQPNSGLYVFIFCVLILVVLAFTSCTNAKKATNFMFAHPEVNAPVCAIQFPVKDSLIKGDSIVMYDTLWGLRIESDTVVTKDTVRITTTLPAKTITKTIHVTDTVIKESTSKVAAIEYKLKQTLDILANNNMVLEKWRSDYYDMRGKRNKFRLWLFIAIGAAGMFTFLKIKKIL